MSWLAVLQALLSVADAVAGYLREGQMLEAGAALANAKNLQVAQDAHRRSLAARDVIADNIARDDAWMPASDPNRRD